MDKVGDLVAEINENQRKIDSLLEIIFEVSGHFREPEEPIVKYLNDCCKFVSQSKRVGFVAIVDMAIDLDSLNKSLLSRKVMYG